MWLEEDAQAALEWIDYEASLCPGCGHPRSVCFAKESDQHYDVVALRCHACAAKEARARKDAQSDVTDTSGLHYIAVDDREG